MWVKAREHSIWYIETQFLKIISNSWKGETWSATYLPLHFNVLSSAGSISHQFYSIWTSTVMQIGWSPESVSFCSCVRRQFLTYMRDLFPRSKEPLGTAGICPLPPHRSCSWADSHKNAPRLPTPLLQKAGMSLGMSERHTVPLSDMPQEIPGLSVQWYIIIFNTTITCGFPAVMWSWSCPVIQMGDWGRAQSLSRWKLLGN